MKAMLPNNQSSGLGSSGRTLLVVGGAIVIAAGLVLYRGELRSEVTSLIGGDDAKPAATVHPHPGLRHPGVGSGGKLAPMHPQVASHQPAHPQSPASGTTPAPGAKPAGPLGAIGAAKNAAAAANQHVAGETGQRVAAASPTAVQAGHPAAASAASGTPKVTVAGISGQSSSTSVAQAGAPARSTTRDSADAPTVMREVYSYEKDARRDPFYSLMNSGELRPTMSDLKLMGILYDESGRRPVAIMRDAITNAQYRVTTGQQLGRMRVAQIKPKVIVFTIEEFGMNRQDSLVLGDTTKARAR